MYNFSFYKHSFESNKNIFVRIIVLPIGKDRPASPKKSLESSDRRPKKTPKREGAFSIQHYLEVFLWSVRSKITNVWGYKNAVSLNYYLQVTISKLSF